MPRSFTDLEDFMSELDRSSNLSDDPFGIETMAGELDDEDLALIGGGRRPLPQKAPRRRRSKNQ